MNANIDIPAADVAMTVFGCKGKDYLAFLKMNYKTSYTHQTRETDGGNSNEIIYSAHCFRDRDSASPRRLSSISPTAP